MENGQQGCEPCKSQCFFRIGQGGCRAVREGDGWVFAAMFSYLSPEQRVPADHPLQPIRQMVDEVSRGLSPRFDRLYAETGRPSIAPEKLLRALLLQILYSVRSERLLMEECARSE